MATRYETIFDAAVGLANAKGRMEGKVEVLTEVIPKIEEYQQREDKIYNSLKVHIEEQHKALHDCNVQYELSKAEREQKAQEFVEGKTSEELKSYLADQPVPYNRWRDAELNVLMELALEVFDI